MAVAARGILDPLAGPRGKATGARVGLVTLSAAPPHPPSSMPPAMAAHSTTNRSTTNAGIIDHSALDSQFVRLSQTRVAGAHS